MSKSKPLCHLVFVLCNVVSIISLVFRGALILISALFGSSFSVFAYRLVSDVPNLPAARQSWFPGW